MLQKRVGDTIYQFPDGMADADVEEALRSAGVLPSSEFADVQSGGTSGQFADVRGGGSSSPDLMRIAQATGNSADVPADVTARGLPAVGRGVAQGVSNLANVGGDISGVRTLASGVAGRDVRVPSPDSVPGEETGEFIGRSALTAALPMGKLGGALSGLVGGAAETGTPEGAAMGAGVGALAEGGTRIVGNLANREKRQAIIAAFRRFVPEKVKQGVEVVDTLVRPERALNLQKAQRTMTEAAEEQAARETIGAAERQSQEPLAAAMAREETTHARAAAEDIGRGRQAQKAELREQTSKGASMSKEDRAQLLAHIENRARVKAATDAAEKAGLQSQKARGAAQFREEGAHRQAIVEDNALTRAEAQANGESELEAAAREAADAFPDTAVSKERVPATSENASGESAASAEALGRQSSMKAKGEKFVVYDRAGKRRELIGPDAVDYAPKKGETTGIEGPNGFQVRDANGGKAPTFGEKVAQSRAGRKVLGGETSFDPGVENRVLDALKKNDIAGARKALEVLNEGRRKKINLQDFVQRLIDKQKGKS